jgi:hypothetical protein
MTVQQLDWNQPAVLPAPRSAAPHLAGVSKGGRDGLRRLRLLDANGMISPVPPRMVTFFYLRGAAP